MESKYKLILFATVFAIIFTTLTYIMPNYKMLWLSLEIITLPIIYYVGYEMLMDKQKEEFEESLDLISQELVRLDGENKELKFKIKVQKGKK